MSFKIEENHPRLYHRRDHTDYCFGDCVVVKQETNKQKPKPTATSYQFQETESKNSHSFLHIVKLANTTIDFCKAKVTLNLCNLINI